MGNYSNYYIKTLNNVKESVPTSSAGTGTISTDGTTVNGVGTSFMTEMPRKSWLVDLDNDEFREILKTDSDTLAYLAQPFTSDIVAGVTPQIIKANIASAREISFVIPIGEADGEVTTQVTSSIPAGLPVSTSKAHRHDSTIQDIVNPCIVDATGTIVITQVIY